MARETSIPDELVSQIDSLRGDTSFDTWLALAISEKVYGSRLTYSAIPGRIDQSGAAEAPEDLWVAMVQLDDGREMFLLWRYATTQGIALAPVFVTEWEDAQSWVEVFGMELNAMNGPPIAWRHFAGGEFVEWLRAPAVDEPETSG